MRVNLGKAETETRGAVCNNNFVLSKPGKIQNSLKHNNTHFVAKL